MPPLLTHLSDTSLLIDASRAGLGSTRSRTLTSPRGDRHASEGLAAASASCRLIPMSVQHKRYYPLFDSLLNRL